MQCPHVCASLTHLNMLVSASIVLYAVTQILSQPQFDCQRFQRVILPLLQLLSLQTGIIIGIVIVSEI